MTFVVAWRTPDLTDPCRSIQLKAPFSQNEKGYIQFRLSAVEEAARTPSSSADSYEAPPATGRRRITLRPNHRGEDSIHPNAKLQLQTIIAYHAYCNSPDPAVKAKWQEYFDPPEGVKLECSHLCHNKCCTNVEHLYPETADVNKLRNGCVACVFINDELHVCCKQTPQCVPSLQLQQEAPRYTVTLEDLDRQATARAHTSTTTTTTPTKKRKN